MHITMIFCASADGLSLQPAAILPKLKNFPQDLQEHEDCFTWSASESGWITEEIFRNWVETAFLPHLATKRIFWKVPVTEPAVLFLDGHSTRDSPDAMASLSANNVFVATIPAHTSHVIQPMELKKKLRSPSEDGLPGRRRMLMKAAIDAAHIAHCPGTIKDAFKTAGISPWDKKLILQDPTLVTEGPVTTLSPSPSRQRGPQLSGRVLATPAATFRVANMSLPHLTQQTGSMNTPDVFPATLPPRSS